MLMREFNMTEEKQIRICDPLNGMATLIYFQGHKVYPSIQFSYLLIKGMKMGHTDKMELI